MSEIPHIDLSGLTDRIPRLTATDVVEDPYRLGQSPTERAAARSESFQRMWTQRVPARFVSASLSNLTPGQDPDQKVSGWLSSRSDTLVLRSDQPGTGKTYAAYAVGNAAARAGVWASAWPMVDLNEAFRPGRDDTAYTVARECDLLVLDDVGRERITEWTLERLQGVMDERWANNRRTVITTNLDGQAFLDRYGAPIVDRVRDGLTTVVVAGESRREPAPW